MKKLLFLFLTASATLTQMAAVPITPAHEAYLARGVMAIVHWRPNTSQLQQWRFGNVSPDAVQLNELDPAQWASAMKAGGIRSVVLVAKHHDGFCLWPSQYNSDYSTTAIPGKFKGFDVVKAVESACRREGLLFGVYLSPWDRHQGSYAKPEYVTYFHNQWAEMFSGKYGHLCEIWLDGANGGDGWYGGANGGRGERRTIPAGYYRKPDLLKAFIRHNPMGLVFDGKGENSIAWCGNESGSSPDAWTYAQKGEDGQFHFMPPEVDTPLRPTWFYYDGQHPKPLRQMVRTYFESVGRGGVLNWGIAPDKTGRICDEDVRRLKEFGDYVRAFNAVDFAKNATYKDIGTGMCETLELRLAAPASFNAVDFGEDLSQGQLATGWKVEVGQNGVWKEVSAGKMVGYRRIARFGTVKGDQVRITVTGTDGRPKIVRPAVRFAATVKDSGEVVYGETEASRNSQNQQQVAERNLPRGTGAVWNMKALNETPRSFAVELPCSNHPGRTPGVESIWIEGEPWHGKPTRVFAWYGLPKGAAPNAKVPAMVLVHGGGGTAFSSWVKTWNDRGYAAIAMDTCAKIPQGQRDGGAFRRHPWSGPDGWDRAVPQVDEPLRDHWTYHAVAAIIRCHSYLRSRPEIDADHIGLTGISWGGYLTSITMSVDRRFKFAAPVYGCGWYDLNPGWGSPTCLGRNPQQYRKWLSLWDPKNFLQDLGPHGVKIPVLWCVGTNDRSYPINAVRRSCNELDPAVPLSLSIKLRMHHSHPPAGDPKEIMALANHYLRGAAPLVEVKSAFLRDGRLHVNFDAHGRKVVKAELLATCDPNPTLHKRVWQSTPVADFQPATGSFSVPLPGKALTFLANVFTDDGLVASTRIFERADWGLVNNPRNPATDWMPGKVGLFGHYLYGKDVAPRVAAEFNVPGLVKQILDAKADYFVLTLGQNTGWMCAPNATYERTVGYPIGSRCCPRDIPMEIARALKPHGIKFMLYLPSQPPNQDQRAEDAFGFPPDGRGDRVCNREAARAWAKVIEEWSRRYGDLVAGWWFDGGYRWIRFDDEIAEIYAAACKRGNPQAVVAFNEGVKHPVRRWTLAGDYLAGEVNEPLGEVCRGRFLDDRQWQLLTYCGSTWGQPNCRFTDDQWVNWLKPVLANGGAVTIDVRIDRPTGIIESKQLEQMKRVFARAKAK